MVVISVMTKMAFCLFAGTLVLNGLVGWGGMEVGVWRGLWGTHLIIAVHFIVAAFTKRAAEEKLATTTVDWRAKWAPFEGWRDWRLQLAVLSAITVFLYWRMWGLKLGGFPKGPPFHPGQDWR